MNIDPKTMEELLRREDERHLNEHFDPNPTEGVAKLAVLGTLIGAVAIIVVSLLGIAFVIGGFLAVVIAVFTSWHIDQIAPYTMTFAGVFAAAYFFIFRRT